MSLFENETSGKLIVINIILSNLPIYRMLLSTHVMLKMNKNRTERRRAVWESWSELMRASSLKNLNLGCWRHISRLKIFNQCSWCWVILIRVDAGMQAVYKYSIWLMQVAFRKSSIWCMQTSSLKSTIRIDAYLCEQAKIPTNRKFKFKQTLIPFLFANRCLASPVVPVVQMSSPPFHHLTLNKYSKSDFWNNWLIRLFADRLAK